MGGFAVALATGNGWLGWLGGAAVAGVLWLRRDPAADSSCAWTPPPAGPDHTVDPHTASAPQTDTPLTSTPAAPER